MTSVDEKTPEATMDAILRYHEDQWAHIRHHESQMSAQTFQLIAFSGAILVGISQLAPSPVMRIVFALIISVLGVNGLLLTLNTEKAVRIHMARARSARRALIVLEEHATDSERFPHLYWHYRVFQGAVISIGLLLLVTSVTQILWP